MKINVKTGDSIVVISGRFKNTLGVLKKIYKNKLLVLVENTDEKKDVKVHKKEILIHLSNVMLYSHYSLKPTRIKIVCKENVKNRVCKHTQNIIS